MLMQRLEISNISLLSGVRRRWYCARLLHLATNGGLAAAQ